MFAKEIGLQHLEHEGGTTVDCSITADESMSCGALRDSTGTTPTSFCLPRARRVLSEV